MFTEVKLSDDKGTHYGLGVHLSVQDGHRSIEHSGEVTGFVSDNVVLPDDGVAVVVLTNHMAGGAATIAQLVASTVAGTGAPTEIEKKTLAIFEGLQKGELDRNLLAPNLKDYFSAQAIADFKSSLGPLVDVSSNGGGAARRDDLPDVSDGVFGQAADSGDLHLSGWEAGAVSGESGGLIAA
jgi:hypothetical protein